MYSLSDNNNKKVQEKLLILAEECNEVGQAVTKILRFGIQDKHPVTNIPNKAHLEEELGDLLCVIGKVIAEAKLDPEAVRLACKAKETKLDNYLKQ